MSNILSGLLLNGFQSGTLATGGCIKNLQVSTTSALVGVLTIGGCGGEVFTTRAGLNGTQSGDGITRTGLDGSQSENDMHGPVYFQLSSPEDVGKARVTWTWA